MIKIHNAFTGGNIRVRELCGDTVLLENEIRDTEGDWFYWAFCVEGAEGRELTFKLGSDRLGYFGPAVSHDLCEWHWLERVDGDSFTYRFGENESKVYFAHDLLYLPDRFSSFCKRKGLAVSELCKSKKGRSVPCLCLGGGETSIIFTSRHHACEATGSYVMEGVIDELSSSPLPNSRVLFVPFVDYDGVVDGDQGKARRPHDHNRDYTDEPLYAEVRAIMKHVDTYGVNYGFDLHSPWHKGGVNDTIFVVRNRTDKLDRYDRFSDIFENEITEGSMSYSKQNDFPPSTEWNQPSANFGYTMNSRPDCTLAFSLESAYFGTPENKVSTERLIELGRCFARVIKKYIEENR
ncbi:MAG: carboxypeptidase family protein [Ruminococcaceae bacterium]|nr:carboxypeptidase family protein [Oscillospiraceae bacterium]